eukprot:gnl/TRDRNA2_/TRDRNA2_144628_c0_seq1.p1 gnl/TRDRNA2_/TRDRNA2_144628_c0~~gnl/TRDRNA2_/TRDRNA2_144628_c0_seq1.p1  ORF type:complete len:310 (+),score=47.72 gnl/TRDRNA2_/TRDRNA2_144628_c0_seq1:105-1034(+)
MSTKAKYAVVTGSNRGLGLAMARRLVQEGFQVAAVCRRMKDARRTVRLLGSACAVPIELDLADAVATVSVAASRIADWLGSSKLVLLVNNAGNSYGSWYEEAWSDSRAVNYQGPVLLTEALLPMLATGASVMMVGSGLGDLKWLSPKYQRLLTKAQTIPDLNKIANRSIDLLSTEHSWVGPYGLSKALLHRATEVFASDSRFKEKRIVVNAVCPGWVSTDMGSDQAPISVEEGAGHILERALRFEANYTGTFVCYCYKNWDEEHTRAWEAKHGKWEADACEHHTATDEDTDAHRQTNGQRSAKKPKKRN